MKLLAHVATFLGAAAIGAGVAMLVAPETGEELRARIRIKLQEYGIIPTDDVDELVERIAIELEESNDEEAENE